MTISMMLVLFSHVTLVIVAAYVIGRSRYLTECIKHPTRGINWVPLTLSFSMLAIIGTFTGLKVFDASANTRIVGVLMGGLMGGPVVGTLVGAISGFFRYEMGGFTAAVCGLYAVFGGAVAGLVRQWLGLKRINWKVAGMVALVAEILQKSAILLWAKPFEAALAFEQAVGVPTTIISVIGSALFFLIIDDIKARQELSGAEAARTALNIASQTLPYLRQGLNVSSAAHTAQLVYDLSGVDYVAITDRHNVLAVVGKETSRLPEEAMLMTHVDKALNKNESTIQYGEGKRIRPLGQGISFRAIAPLMAHREAVGTLQIFRAANVDQSEVDLELVDGLAKLLSVQIQLAEVDAQRKMREKAELKALQAQINPHFLFNTLSIIMSFCRTDPDMARKLLGHLATMMERNFSKREDLVSLSDELDGIEAYLEIVRARFGARLRVQVDVPEAFYAVRLPVLSLQPLVENAVQHGLFPKVSDCRLSLTAARDKTDIVLQVQDNGIGIPPDKLTSIFDDESSGGIGIQNVSRRLQSLYGEHYHLQVQSKLGEGTVVSLRIPVERMNQAI